MTTGKGTSNPTVLENLSRINSLAMERRPGARLYGIIGRCNALTGRADSSTGRQRYWLYYFHFAGAQGAGDRWSIDSDGTITYLGEDASRIPSGWTTDSILSSLRVDTDRLVQSARVAGFDECATPAGQYINVNFYTLGSGWILCTMNFSPDEVGPGKHGGTIWFDPSTGEVSGLPNACS